MTEPAPVFTSGIDHERLTSQLRFILEVDKLKRVLRRSLLIDGARRENSAEHSWHVAVLARVFAEYAPAGTDIDHVVNMLLVHDIVEIDAGDTYIYDQGRHRLSGGTGTRRRGPHLRAFARGSGRVGTESVGRIRRTENPRGAIRQSHRPSLSATGQLAHRRRHMAAVQSLQRRRTQERETHL